MSTSSESLLGGSFKPSPRIRASISRDSSRIKDLENQVDQLRRARNLEQLVRNSADPAERHVLI